MLFCADKKKRYLIITLILIIIVFKFRFRNLKIEHIEVFATMSKGESFGSSFA